MKGWLMGCICALVSGLASATPAAADTPVEASMLVTGAVVIAPDGSVRSHTLDQAEKLSPMIVSFIDKAVSAGAGSTTKCTTVEGNIENLLWRTEA